MIFLKNYSRTFLKESFVEFLFKKLEEFLKKSMEDLKKILGEISGGSSYGNLRGISKTIHINCFKII